MLAHVGMPASAQLTVRGFPEPVCYVAFRGAEGDEPGSPSGPRVGHAVFVGLDAKTADDLDTLKDSGGLLVDLAQTDADESRALFETQRSRTEHCGVEPTTVRGHRALVFRRDDRGAGGARRARLKVEITADDHSPIMLTVETGMSRQDTVDAGTRILEALAMLLSCAAPR